LYGQGKKKPLPVQEAVIPALLKGRDVLIKSRTGTGKTLAFLLPVLQKIDTLKPYPQSLIVTPTRELSAQVADEARKLGGAAGVKIAGIVGGRDFYTQKNKLAAAPHILVGTPGRLLDHLRKRSVSLGGVKMFVLDEVDEMLQRGFLEEIAELAQLVAAHRQTVACSATLPEEVAALAGRIMTSPRLIDLAADTLDTVNIRQYIVKAPADKRREALASVLRKANPYLAIVFCRSRESAEEIDCWLAGEGFSCAVLKGDMSENKRLKALRDFRAGRVQVLVATDLAARGLDVEGVSHIINFELPPDRQQYVHRVGRTGRAGAAGEAITLYTPEEARKITALEEKLGFKFLARNTAGEEITRPLRKTARAARQAGGRTKEPSRPFSARPRAKANNKRET
jgi:ATP-dependent RNA helicase DeaD